MFLHVFCVEGCSSIRITKHLGAHADTYSPQKLFPDKPVGTELGDIRQAGPGWWEKGCIFKKKSTNSRNKKNLETQSLPKFATKSLKDICTFSQRMKLFFSTNMHNFFKNRKETGQRVKGWGQVFMRTGHPSRRAEDSFPEGWFPKGGVDGA